MLTVPAQTAKWLPARAGVAASVSRLAPVSLNLGIVGLPECREVNALQRADAQQCVGRQLPLATISRTRGVVPLPDPRLDELAKMFASEKIVHAPVTFVDIAGIVKGASEGAGLGSRFLANIRESDAICQVVRVFTDDDVAHRRPDRSQIRHRGDRNRAHPGRPANTGAGSAGLEKARTRTVALS